MIPLAPFGHTVFCDDIREEVAGKHSFIGVYGGNIVFKELPAQLPKLGLAISYYEKIGESRLPVTLKVFVPGPDGDVVILQSDLPMEGARADAPRVLDNTPAGDQPLTLLQANLVLTPVQFHKPGRIRVRVYIGKKEEEIRLGSLTIEALPPASEGVTASFASESESGPPAS